MVDRLASTEEPPDASAQAVFHQEWRIYRTLIDHNYLYHHEVYDRLHQILVEEAPQSFRFVDVACGDASEPSKTQGSPGTTESTSPAPPST